MRTADGKRAFGSAGHERRRYTPSPGARQDVPHVGAARGFGTHSPGCAACPHRRRCPCRTAPPTRRRGHRGLIRRKSPGGSVPAEGPQTASGPGGRLDGPRPVGRLPNRHAWPCGGSRDPPRASGSSGCRPRLRTGRDEDLAVNSGVAPISLEQDPRPQGTVTPSAPARGPPQRGADRGSPGNSMQCRNASATAARRRAVTLHPPAGMRHAPTAASRRSLLLSPQPPRRCASGGLDSPLPPVSWPQPDRPNRRVTWAGAYHRARLTAHEVSCIILDL
jgi:hypothetical protein